MDILVPADAEQYVFDLITSHGHTVGATPQSDSTGAMSLPFVSYEITGGSRRYTVPDAVLVMVRCYAVSRATAFDLCREGYAFLLSAHGRPAAQATTSTSVGHPVFYPVG